MIINKSDDEMKNYERVNIHMPKINGSTVSCFLLREVILSFMTIFYKIIQSFYNISHYYRTAVRKKLFYITQQQIAI